MACRPDQAIRLFWQTVPMDGETIRLVATAAGAVTAGFGGAWLAGRYNSKNTRATIEAARVQAELNRQQEHTQWLRNRKVKCYADLLANMRQIEQAYGALDDEDAGKIAKLEKIEAVSQEIFIIAPRHIYDATIEVVKSFSLISRASRPNPDRRARHAEYDAARKTLSTKYTLLERLIRQDLGVEEFVGEAA